MEHFSGLDGTDFFLTSCGCTWLLLLLFLLLQSSFGFVTLESQKGSAVDAAVIVVWFRNSEVSKGFCCCCCCNR